MQQRKSTSEAAVGRWRGILTTLGIDEKFLRNSHGPCPYCAGHDRFRFDDRDGRGSWICSQCGSGDGFALLGMVYGWSFRDAAIEVDRVVGTIPEQAIVQQRSDEEKLAALRRVLEGSKTVALGDPVWQYLHNRVGIESVYRDIRFHPSLRYTTPDGESLGYHPAMLAILRYPDGNPASIHRTYLTKHGEKANVPEPKKIMAGKPLKTASVRLSDPGRTLGIAEGLETALAAAKRFGVPFWAATNSVLLENWEPPEGVARVVIAGDNDGNFAGQVAAYILARRLAKDGYRVDVRIPQLRDTDFADVQPERILQ